LPLHLVHLIFSYSPCSHDYPAVADDIASFSSSSGLIFDASPLLGGPRAKRSAMVIENGKVLHVAVEDEPPQ
jgi:peroxiredoxin